MINIYLIIIAGMLCSYGLGYWFGVRTPKPKRKNRETIPVPDYYSYFEDGKIDSPEELILFTQEHASELYLSLCTKLRNESDEADVQR